MSPNRRQTLPSITLRYASDEVTGELTWFLIVSDGEDHAEPVKVSADTAAGIAQTIDVALPLPVILSGEPTSAEHVVRGAHVQTLAAKLAEAQAELRAAAPARSTTITREAPRLEVAAEPAARAPRPRRTAAAKLAEAPAPVTVTAAEEEPDLGEPLTSEPVLPDLEPVESPRYADFPETLPRSSHLTIPAVDEF
jgi:hypothetical protein